MIALLLAAALSCGVERQPVKVGADPAAASVDLKHPVLSTVDALRDLHAPDKPAARTKLEERLVVINADLVLVKHESDGDYHLVLREGSRTMIAEIPDPRCVPARSPFYAGVQRARKQMAGIHAGPVRVTGVLFFDFIHGQTGVAPNGVELHPVLDIIQR